MNYKQGTYPRMLKQLVAPLPDNRLWKCKEEKSDDADTCSEWEKEEDPLQVSTEDFIKAEETNNAVENHLNFVTADNSSKLRTGSVDFYCKNCGLLFGDFESLRNHSCWIGEDMKIDTNKGLDWTGKQKKTDPLNSSSHVASVDSSPNYSDDEVSSEVNSPITVPRSKSDSPTTSAFKMRIKLKTQKDAKQKCATRRSYSCGICGKNFASQSLCKKRFGGEELFSCNTCAIVCSWPPDWSSYDRKLTEQPVLKSDDQKQKINKAFTCDVCYKSFSVQWYLELHKKNHSQEKQLTCDICGKTFSVAWYLKIHKSKHAQEKLFTCDVCGKSFSVLWYLKIHNEKHVKNDLFHCDVCGKNFSVPWYLKVHKRKHSGEKPFKCSVCDASFAQSANLTTHKRKYLHY